MRTRSFYEMNNNAYVQHQNELAKTQEIYPTEDMTVSYASEDYNDDLCMEMEDEIITTYLHNRVQKLVEEHLAEKSQEIIDLAINTYILQRKNDKIEKRSYAITKKTVSRNKK